MSDPAAAPIFVIGIARSGTNLVARMLARHPQVTVALDPLLPVFRSWRNAIMRAHASREPAARLCGDSPFQDYYFQPDGPAQLDALLTGSADCALAGEEIGKLRVAVHERASLESPPLATRLSALDGATYAELLSSALSMIAGTQPVARVALKEVWIVEFVPMLARAFPSALFFIVERDPRAIIASLLSMAQRESTQAAHVPSYARHWRKAVALARRFAADPHLRSRVRVITYEALARNPERHGREMCNALGLQFHDDMLNPSADGWIGNSSFDDVGHGVYTSSLDRWRVSLRPEIRRVVEYLCAPEMSLTAYEPVDEVGVDAPALAWWQDANATTGSWRSDAGDPVIDTGGELLRHLLLAPGMSPEAAMVRRCFLFEETFGAIREAQQATASTE